MGPYSRLPPLLRREPGDCQAGAEAWATISIPCRRDVTDLRFARLVHPNAFFSFSTIISGRSPRFHDLLRAVNPDRLLVESDFSHTAQLDAQVRRPTAFSSPGARRLTQCASPRFGKYSRRSVQRGNGAQRSVSSGWRPIGGSFWSWSQRGREEDGKRRSRGGWRRHRWQGR